MSKLSSVWLFSERKDRYAELLAAAKALGKSVNAIVLDNGEPLASPMLSVDTQYVLAKQTPSRCVEDYAETIADVINKRQSARGVLLLSTTKRDKAIAARLSILLDAPLLNEAADIGIEEGALRVKQRLYGGLAIGEKKVKASFAIVTLPPGTFATSTFATSICATSVNEHAENPARQIRPLDYIPAQHSLMRQERYPKPIDSVELTKAKCVVGVGRGLVAQKDLVLIQSLARCLHAQVGCSRPIAEGEHWLGRQRYIGISGVMLQCDVYLALGISGQIQHMVGVNDVKLIIAINKDKHAPIFQSADYGIVGDLYTVVPMLIKILQS